MRVTTPLLALVLVLACAPGPARAESPDAAVEPGARVALVIGQVEFLGPEAEAWKPAEVNLALQAGDRLRTAAEARVELQFEGGALVRLGAGSEAELLAAGTSPVVRLVAGRAYARAPRAERGTLTLEAGDRRVGAADGAAFRADIESPDAVPITVTAGRVAVESPGGRVEAARGERVEGLDRGPVPTSLLARDDFDRWNADRDAALARAVPDGYAPRYVPGLADLDRYGSWVRTDDYGYVWRPDVSSDWHPYLHGRWAYRPYYGWVWVAAEPWGWAPYHYGRWVTVGIFGWVWVPGAVFTPVVVAPPVIISTVIVSRPPVVVVRRPVVVAPPVVVVPPVVVRRPVVVAPRVVAPPVVVRRPVAVAPRVVAPPAVVRRPVAVAPRVVAPRVVAPRAISAPVVVPPPAVVAPAPRRRAIAAPAQPVNPAPAVRQPRTGGSPGAWRAVPGGGPVRAAAPVVRSGSRSIEARAPGAQGWAAAAGGGAGYGLARRALPR